MKYLTQKGNFEHQTTEDEIKHIQAKAMIIETEKEMSLDTDGEVYLKTPINIQVASQKIDFIIG